MSRYNKISIALRYYLLGRQYHRALAMFMDANEVHCGLRKDGETPEFQHQIEMALHATTLKGIDDEESLIMTILGHDMMEDYNIDFDEFSRRYGDTVANACYVMNKNNHTTAHMYNLIAYDKLASVAKGLDRINNLSTMQGVFTVEKQQQYADDALVYVLPMIKHAEQLFPSQIPAYMNIKTMIKSQISLVHAIAENNMQSAG